MYKLNFDNNLIAEQILARKFGVKKRRPVLITVPAIQPCLEKSLHCRLANVVTKVCISLALFKLQC